MDENVAALDLLLDPEQKADYDRLSRDNRWMPLEASKKRFGLAEDVPVVCCYEAGSDGFWIDRFLSHDCTLPGLDVPEAQVPCCHSRPVLVRRFVTKAVIQRCTN